MKAISLKLTEQNTQLCVISNDELGLNAKVFAEGTRSTNRIVTVKEVLQNLEIAEVVGPQKEESSKRSLPISLSGSSESFNTVTDAASPRVTLTSSTPSGDYHTTEADKPSEISWALIKAPGGAIAPDAIGMNALSAAALAQEGGSHASGFNQTVELSSIGMQPPPLTNNS